MTVIIYKVMEMWLDTDDNGNEYPLSDLISIHSTVNGALKKKRELETKTNQGKINIIVEELKD